MSFWRDSEAYFAWKKQGKTLSSFFTWNFVSWCQAWYNAVTWDRRGQPGNVPLLVSELVYVDRCRYTYVAYRKVWFGRVNSYLYKGKCMSLMKKNQQLKVTNISNCLVTLAVAFSKHWHVVVMQLLWRNHTVRQEAFLQTRMGRIESAAVFSLQGFL